MFARRERPGNRRYRMTVGVSGIIHERAWTLSGTLRPQAHVTLHFDPLAFLRIGRWRTGAEIQEKPINIGFLTKGRLAIPAGFEPATRGAEIIWRSKRIADGIEPIFAFRTVSHSIDILDRERREAQAWRSECGPHLALPPLWTQEGREKSRRCIGPAAAFSCVGRMRLSPSANVHRYKAPAPTSPNPTPASTSIIPACVAPAWTAPTPARAPGGAGHP